MGGNGRNIEFFQGKGGMEKSKTPEILTLQKGCLFLTHRNDFGKLDICNPPNPQFNYLEMESLDELFETLE